ncbi:MAG TPA: vanadium-dependent haloperoxidase [Steroidobacteraceae bacterium]|nr:vanadium-dependent haloperoxidase [Steroidobacteraceae bacterium]
MSGFRITLLAIAGVFSTAALAREGNPQTIVDWNAQLEATIPASAGPTLPRYYAMMHIAMFDAINAIDGGYKSYTGRIPAANNASTDAAAAQAAHDVLVGLLPAQAAAFDAALAAQLKKIAPNRAALGAQIGREAARRILEKRANDGWSTPQSFTPPALPGVWQPTPPAFAPAAFAQAGDAKPFALPTPYYFLPRRPPALNSQEYADAVNEIKAIGGATSAVRTADQTVLARNWASIGYKELWSAQWNHVARDTARFAGLSQIETARLFALLNVAMHDGVQTAQASKFVYQLWRPVTAIQRANEDLNPLTDADPTWMPLLPTPPYPSYAGNMACIGASSAQLLILYFGANEYNVSLTWTGLNGNADVTRKYSNFWAVAEDQAVSREYGGIHFHFDTTASQEVCPKVAAYAFNTVMKEKRD